MKYLFLTFTHLGLSIDVFYFDSGGMFMARWVQNSKGHEEFHADLSTLVKLVQSMIENPK